MIMIGLTKTCGVWNNVATDESNTPGYYVWMTCLLYALIPSIRALPTSFSSFHLPTSFHYSTQALYFFCFHISYPPPPSGWGVQSRLVYTVRFEELKTICLGGLLR